MIVESGLIFLTWRLKSLPGSNKRLAWIPLRCCHLEAQTCSTLTHTFTVLWAQLIKNKPIKASGLDQILKTDCLIFVQNFSVRFSYWSQQRDDSCWITATNCNPTFQTVRQNTVFTMKSILKVFSTVCSKFLPWHWEQGSFCTTKQYW